MFAPGTCHICGNNRFVTADEMIAPHGDLVQDSCGQCIHDREVLV